MYINKIKWSWQLKSKNNVLFLQVNELVSRGMAKDSTVKDEFVVVSDTLSKNLYFFPGVVTEEIKSIGITQAPEWWWCFLFQASDWWWCSLFQASGRWWCSLLQASVPCYKLLTGDDFVWCRLTSYLKP